MTKPILFNTEMVRAILDGRKTVTRRGVHSPLLYTRDTLPDIVEESKLPRYWDFGWHGEKVGFATKAPYQPGDILYVRETYFKYAGEYVYKASAAQPEIWKGMWHPSIHMPREAARIWLRVTDVRVERLQTSFFEPICPIFAVQAEGIDIGDTCWECIENYGEPCCVDTVDEDGSDLYGGECGELDQSRGEFSDLWDRTIKPADRERYGWAANPWVWVIAVERCEKPEEVRLDR